LPQGCAKKIDVGLLLADLALQLRDPGTGGRELRIRLRRLLGLERTFAGATRSTQSVGAAQTKMITPLVEILTQNLKFA
jgi:hypothetical protein